MIVKAFSKLGELTAEDHGIRGEPGKPVTTEDFVSKIVSIPLFAELEDAEIDHICEVLKEYQQVNNG
jgi:dTDP-4-amino-4,6-dideoxygalactose transaminase